MLSEAFNADHVLIFSLEPVAHPFLFLSKLFTPPQNCDALWGTFVVYDHVWRERRGRNPLCFIHAESYLSSSPTYLFHFWRSFQIFSFFKSSHFFTFSSQPCPVAPLGSFSWCDYSVSVLYCVCILDNRVSQLWLIFYWLNEKLSAKFR